MQPGKLPNLFPMSKGGIFAFGVSTSAFITKLIANSSPYKSILIVCFLLTFFFIDIAFCFFKVSFLNQSRLFLFGTLVFIALDFSIFKNAVPSRSENPSEHSAQFSHLVSRLLSKSDLPLELQSIAKGLVLGSSKYLPLEIKNRTREGGILHLFAASGLHLGIFIGFALIIFRKIFGFFRPIPYILALLFGFLYLYLLAFPVSFLRAYSFAVYSIVGLIFYRKTLPGDTLSYSSATIALFLPQDFLSVGFLLSFGAVFGIFFIKPILDSFLFPKWKHLLKDNVTLSLACSFSTFPTLVYYFHSFSFGSFWINLIVVPYASLLLPCLYLNLTLEFFFGGELISYFWRLTDFFLSLFMRLVTELTNSISFFFTWRGTPYPILLYLIFLLLIFLIKYMEHCIPQKNKHISFFEWLPKKLSLLLKYSILLILLFGFHPFGIWYLSNSESHKSKFQSVFFKGNFFIQNQTSYFILGKCYAEKNFKKAQTMMALSEVKTILIEDESCLKQSLQLKKSIERKIGETVAIVQSNSSNLMPVFYREGDDSKILIRYNGDKKYLQKLLMTLRNLETKQKLSRKVAANYLVLDFPTWSKEKPEDWKKFQKLLGISPYWKIMSVEELLVQAIYDTDRDPELSFR